MFTLEESAHLGFMLRMMVFVLAAAVLVGGCAMGVHWMHMHHYHIPRPHLSLAARQP
jgi:hypothetical protein